jgi:hypothetical protein
LVHTLQFNKLTLILCLQTYAALFTIYNIAANPRQYRKFQDHTDNTQEHAVLAIFYACFEQFITDTVTFVQEKVQLELQDHCQGDITTQAICNTRQKHLNEWSDCAMPLSVNGDALQHLIVSVRSDNKVNYGLPYRDLPEYTMKEFAKNAIAVATANPKNHKAPAPFLSGTHFIFLIRVAYTIAQSLLPDHSAADLRRKIILLMTIVINELQIHVVPWAPPSPSHRSGPKVIAPSAFWWRQVSAITAAERQQQVKAIQDNTTAGMAADAARRTREASGFAVWSMASTDLNLLSVIIRQRSKPVDFVYDNTILDRTKFTGKHAWIVEQYDRAIVYFNMNNPAHRMLLYAALIVAHLLPNIFLSTDYKPQQGNLTPAQIIDQIQYAPFGTRTRGGLTEQKPAIIAFMILALGLLEPDSPLRQNTRTGFGEKWTAKFGKFKYNRLDR